MKRRTGFAKLGYDHRVRSNPEDHEKGGLVTKRFEDPNPLSDEQRQERERRLRNEALLRQAAMQKDSPFNPEAESE